MRVSEKTIRSILHRRKLVAGLLALEQAVTDELCAEPGARLSCGRYYLTLDRRDRLVIEVLSEGSPRWRDPDQLELDLNGDPT